MPKNNEQIISIQEPSTVALDSLSLDAFDSCSITKIVSMYPLLSEQEEKDLLKKKGTDEWEDARDQLVLRNLRLVLWIAKRYTHCDGMSFEDVIEYGIVGLMIGIDRYDAASGAKLGTYAVNWIQKIIYEEVMIRQGLITVPDYMAGIISKLRQERHRMIQENFMEPSIQELVANSSVEPVSRDTVMKAMNATCCGSLDAPMSSVSSKKDVSDSTMTVADFIATEHDIAETATDHVLVETILARIEQFSDVEQSVLCYYLGLKNEQPKTFRECGEILGYSTEYCRKIYRRVIAKLQEDFASDSHDTHKAQESPIS